MIGVLQYEIYITVLMMCMLQMTFRRPATDRQLTFEEISKEARLSIDEVCHVAPSC